MKNAINWFEIPVTDMPRAIGFYQNMLGVELKQQTMDGIEMAVFPYDDKNVSGCLVKADFMQPGDRGSLVYLNVEGFMDQAIERATAEGSSLFFPKTPIGEHGYIAHLSDSEGNKIALHSMAA